MTTVLVVEGLSSAAFAQSLQSLTSNRLNDFDDVPALYGRAFVTMAFKGLHENCPSYPPINNVFAADLAQYLVSGRQDLQGSFNDLDRNLRLNGYLATHDGEQQVAAIVKARGCSPEVHGKWIQTATKYLTTESLGGKVDGPIKQLCEQHRQRGGDCGCFAMQFDWETTPDQRRSVLSAQDKKQAIQVLLRQGGTRQRLSTKCGASPDFGPAPRPVGEPISPLVYEGYYRIPPSKGESMRCLFQKARVPGQYSATCSFGPRDTRITGIGVLDGSTLLIDWGNRPLMPRTWFLQADGGMRAELEARRGGEYVLSAPR